MTDFATTAPEATASHPLRAALIRAWNTVTWAIPPDSWLDAAVAALTAPIAPPTTAEPHHHDQPEALSTCGAQTLDELRRACAETRQATTATSCRRRELADLKAHVRQRAIDTLTDNPNLEGCLHDALDAWSLPGIPTDHTVQVTVPMTVTVAATDQADARREAVRLLEQRCGALGYDVSVDLQAVQYLSVSGE